MSVHLVVPHSPLPPVVTQQPIHGTRSRAARTTQSTVSVRRPGAESCALPTLREKQEGWSAIALRVARIGNSVEYANVT